MEWANLMYQFSHMFISVLLIPVLFLHWNILNLGDLILNPSSAKILSIDLPYLSPLQSFLAAYLCSSIIGTWMVCPTFMIDNKHWRNLDEVEIFCGLDRLGRPHGGGRNWTAFWGIKIYWSWLQKVLLN